jgi:nucleolar protein 12
MTSLAELFSDTAKEKFERKIKPEEFIPKKRVYEEEEKPKKEKKPKHSKVKADAAAAVAAEGEAAASKEGAEGDTENDENAVGDDSRTVFIGNLPTDQTTKTIKALCQEFGEVDSIRLRSVPVAGTKVDEAGNQNLVKKVCTNSRKFGDQKGSFNAYVKFKDVESVAKALSANNRVLSGRHLRFDTAVPSKFDPKSSCFIGSLPHYTDEEELRKHFAEALPNGQDDIESVRLIRDPETLVGKGIGYVLFKNRDAVLQALSLHEKKFKKRELRVTVCAKRTKRMYAQKRAAEKVEGDGKGDSEEGNGESTPSAKRSRTTPTFLSGSNKKGTSRSKTTNPNAERRINLKNVQTKKKVMKERGQVKAVPGKKGKRLGGVVKRAMKDQRNEKKKK